MPEYPTPEEAYNRCNDQLDRARVILNMHVHGNSTLELVNAMRRISGAVAYLNVTMKALDERVTSLARDVEMLAGDDFGDGLPF